MWFCYQFFKFIAIVFVIKERYGSKPIVLCGNSMVLQVSEMLMMSALGE